MPSKPNSAHRPPTNAPDRVEALGVPDDDPDITATLNEVDTTRPLAARDGEHGHIDGPRGIQLFHKHDDPPGGKEHGHKRGTYGLAATVGLNDYVPPLAATDPPGADQTTDPTPAAVPDDRTSEPGRDAGSDTAGSGRSTDLDLIGEHNDKVIAAFVQRIARLAETERHARTFSVEVEIVTALARLVAVSADQLHQRELVGTDVITQVKDTIDRWAGVRGVTR